MWVVEPCCFILQIKKKRKIQTRGRKMKPPKDLFTLLVQMVNGAKCEGLMKENIIILLLFYWNIIASNWVLTSQCMQQKIA